MAVTATRAEGGSHQLLLTIAAVACAFTPLDDLYKMATAPEPLYPDFFGLWTFGRYLLSHAPGSIYDGHGLLDYQVGLGVRPGSDYPFHYPPWILLLLAPFGALPYPIALGAWLLLTFAAYVAALAAWRWPWPVLGLLLTAPATAVCAIVGQNGFATGALLLGGLRLLRVRPLLAGALLGSMVIKPQLAVMVPFVLLLGKHWRAMAGACLSVAVLTLAATLAFGPGIWGAWLDYMRGHAAALSEGHQVLLEMMPTVTSAVLLLGGGTTTARLIQVAAVLAGLLAVWRVRADDGPESLAAVTLATILATPYAFHYDLPAVTGALLAVIAARMAGTGGFRPLEFPVLLACVLMSMILPARLGALAAVVPATFAVGLWLICRVAASPTASDGTALLAFGRQARVPK
ncbi:MAG TPA: glycosyltransferase family 87 protein [Acetobacteraceae bacterium]